MWTYPKLLNKKWLQIFCSSQIWPKDDQNRFWIEQNIFWKVIFLQFGHFKAVNVYSRITLGLPWGTLQYVFTIFCTETFKTIWGYILYNMWIFSFLKTGDKFLLQILHFQFWRPCPFGESNIYCYELSKTVSCLKYENNCWQFNQNQFIM